MINVDIPFCIFIVVQYCFLDNINRMTSRSRCPASLRSAKAAVFRAKIAANTAMESGERGATPRGAVTDTNNTRQSTTSRMPSISRSGKSRTVSRSCSSATEPVKLDIELFWELIEDSAKY